MILKSGANKWHGSAFEFIQNDAFNAKNYFTPAGESTPLRWNEYGGSIGGPILRDKLFFYFTYQRARGRPFHLKFRRNLQRRIYPKPTTARRSWRQKNACLITVTFKPVAKGRHTATLLEVLVVTKLGSFFEPGLADA